MAITPANTTHPIKPYTFSGTDPVNLATILGISTDSSFLLAQVKWWALQNKQSGTSVYVQESLAAAAADSWEIPGGESWGPPADPNGNSYDVREYWIRPTASSDVVVVMYKQ